MEQSNASLNGTANGTRAAVQERELVTVIETNKLNRDQITTTPEKPQAPVVVPEAKPETEAQTPLPPKEGSKPNQKRRLLILAVLAIAAVFGGTFGFRWWQYASTHETTDDAYITGNVHPVSSRINGTVVDVLVNDNQQVRRGQLLVKLDPRDYQVQVQEAEAALEGAQRQALAARSNVNLASGSAQGNNQQAQGNVSSAQAAISTAVAAVKAAQTGVPSAQAQVAQADANLQKAQTDYNRYQELYQSGAVARQQLDAAKATYLVSVAQKNSAVQAVAQAQANLAQAQESVVKAQAQLAAAKGGLSQAQATNQQTEVNRSQYAAAQSAIAQAQAKLNDALLQLQYTNITAPSAGRVGNKSAQVGQRLQSGTPVMAIVDNEEWVTANFKETQLERMRPGEEVEVKIDAFPHHPFLGRVDSFAPGSGATFALLPADNATGNFTKIVQRIPVKIVLDPQSIKGFESRITPGMSVEASVNVK